MTSSNPELRPSSTGSASDSSAEVNSYIASLHLERNNTRVGHQHLIQRRKTLVKQAHDPQADQEALEREIRQVERLASLLGRRQTRFDRKGRAPRVNHDLDSTLEGFFEVDEDHERVGEILLSAGHRHGPAEGDDELDGLVNDPELTAKNIHSAPSALIAQEQQPGDYQHIDDPFDKIEEMNLAESPSGSAEYLPLDTYKSEEITMAKAPADDARDASAAGRSAEARAAGSKVAGHIADDEDDDEVLLSVNRSNTWKQQSSALIKEREQYGPALPTIADDDEEEEKGHAAAAARPEADPSSNDGEEPASTAAPNKVILQRRDAALTRKISMMRARVVAAALDSLAHAGGSSAAEESAESDDASAAAAPVAKAASEAEPGLESQARGLDAAGSSDPPGKTVVDEYMDILDFIDAGQQPDDAPSDHDDGHISSDLLGNSDSSDSSELDLSASDSSDSEADSDSHYLARLIQPRRLSVVNVVDAAPAGQQAGHEPAGARSAAPAADGSRALESAAVATAGVLNNRSTLRRNRRMVSRGRALRGGRVAALGPRAAPSTQSADETVADSSEYLPLALQSSLSLGIHTDSDIDCRPPTAGLAQLAGDAIAAAEQQSKGRGRRIQPLAASTTRHKPLPPIPDRVARTLEVADAKAIARAPPPLPSKERPRLPRVLAEDGLATRAELSAACERPSSMRLFGAMRPGSDALDPPQGSPRALERPSSAQSPSSARHASSSADAGADADAPLGLREWLQRTDMLLPSHSRVPKPLPYPPNSSGKTPTFVSYHYQPAEDTSPENQSKRTASGRVVKKVTLLPPAQPDPRPSSARSSILSSASVHSNSPHISCASAATSPASSNRNSVASVAPAPPLQPEAPGDCPASPDTFRPSDRTAEADPETALFTPVTAQSGVPHGAPPKPLPAVPSTAAKQQQQQQPDGCLSPVSAMAGPTVFSAPPGADADFDPAATGMVEPSAPMLIEPTAPEFPADWGMGAPGYAFPTPTQYAPTAPEPMSPHDVMGFALPSAATFHPHYNHQQAYEPMAPPEYPQSARQRPPKLPTKPRPYQPDVISLQNPPSEAAPATAVLSPSAEYIMVEGGEVAEEDEDEEDEKAQLNAIADEYQNTTASSAAPSHENSALPSRTNSVTKASDVAALVPSALSVVTQIKKLTADDMESADVNDPPLPEYKRDDSTAKVSDPAQELLEKERQRESKRKAALFELVDTERTYTDDLRMVVELFLLPIQLLGNRKIVDVIFGDMVKITEMNGKMYFDMITRLGPLACLVDPKRAGRNRRKKKNALRSAASPHVGNPRSVLQGSSIRSPATPASVSTSASNTMSRRLSNPGEPPYPSPRASIYSYDAAQDSVSLKRAASRNEDRLNSDDMSIRTSNSGGSNVDSVGTRGLFSAPAERQSSVRSRESVPEEEEYDEDDASKWTENQVLDYFKNVCIGDVMASYLKDFSEHYALYSANHDKAIEYLKLVRESSSRLNLRNDATRDAHQKLLLTLEQAEKDPRVRRLRLESFLLAPVQRVMRYPLLLEALLKYTPEDHPDHEDVALALSISGSVATEVDRKSEELMNRQRLAELQSTFDWAHLLGGVQLKLDTFTKLVGQRKFVRKGPLRKASSGKHLYAILFNDFMMITVSDRRGGVWCYEPYRLPIQTYDLLARDPIKDQFELVNLKNGEVLQLRADTAAEAGDWVKDIMKTSNYCYEVMCEALRSGIQVSKVKSVISPEARNKILLGSKPTAIGKRH